MLLNKNFQEFLKLLELNRVKFLVVGGYAVGFHGFPRYTGDFDVFVAISPENAKALLKTFEDFGFASMSLTESDFLEKEIVIEIGREPLKIQVLTGIDGVEFGECYSRRVEFEASGVKVPFISFQDLLKNKAASPRSKDKIDYLELSKRNVPPVQS